MYVKLVFNSKEGGSLGTALSKYNGIINHNKPVKNGN